MFYPLKVISDLIRVVDCVIINKYRYVVLFIKEVSDYIFCSLGNKIIIRIFSIIEIFIFHISY